MKKEYKMALAEVNQILMYTEENIVSKIPEKFKKFIENNMDQNHIIEINKNKSLVEQNIMEETKQILALIYRDYICSKEERANLILQEQQERQKIEKEKQEKYNIDFEKRNESKKIKSIEEKYNFDFEKRNESKKIKSIEEKYNFDFEKGNENKKSKNIVEELEEKSLIEFKEKKWYEKIINKILKIFKFKKQ